MRFRSTLPALFALAVLAGAGPARAARVPAPASPAAAAADSILYAVRFLSANKIGMALTNYGFIGTDFHNGNSSFEYPRGTSHMHMVRGGLWVGGLSIDEGGAFIGVSTASQDANAGADAASPDSKISEYTPAGRFVGARSTLQNEVFSSDAVSEMDMFSQFSDLPAAPARNHRPLNVLVTQYNYEWSFSEYAHFVIFHYVIKNVGPPLRDVYVGLYNELASGNMRNATSYPPSGWFRKKQIGWIDSLSMFTERYCQSNALFPNNCRYDLVPEVVGVKYLGAKPSVLADTSNIKLTFAAWSFNPGALFLDTDTLKYQMMSRGTRQQLSLPLPDSLAPASGDPVDLMAAGPFSSIETGDSVSVDFAYLAEQPVAANYANVAPLVKRAGIAQRAYDLHYVVPVPPPSPRLKIVTREHAVDYYWNSAPEDFIDRTSPVGKDFEGYRVYLGLSRDTLALIGQYDLAVAPHDTTGFNTTLDSLKVGGPWTFAGDPTTYTYKFTFDHLRDGFKYFAAVTAYDLGTSDIESLESGAEQNEKLVVPGLGAGEAHGRGVTVFPNPYRVEASWDRGANARDHYLWFGNLPPQCSLHIYTLAGDLIYQTDFDGATYHGQSARGIYNPGTDLSPVLSGSTFGWDMITREGQAAATGLYLWAVEDKHTGKRQSGKFLLVKSDREHL